MHWVKGRSFRQAGIRSKLTPAFILLSWQLRQTRCRLATRVSHCPELGTASADGPRRCHLQSDSCSQGAYVVSVVPVCPAERDSCESARRHASCWSLEIRIGGIRTSLSSCSAMRPEVLIVDIVPHTVPWTDTGTSQPAPQFTYSL